MTCADSIMPISVIHEAAAQYLAAVMFAVTVVVGGGLRSMWRRKRRNDTQTTGLLHEHQPITQRVIRLLHGTTRRWPSKPSSEGRHEESS